MAMTGAEIKTMYYASPDTIAHELGRILRDFGYTHATDELVKGELKAQIENGAGPSNLNYGLWIQTYLRDGID